MASTVNYALIAQGINWALRDAIMVICAGEILGHHVLASRQWLVLVIFMFILDILELALVLTYTKVGSAPPFGSPRTLDG